MKFFFFVKECAIVPISPFADKALQGFDLKVKHFGAEIRSKAVNSTALKNELGMTLTEMSKGRQTVNRFMLQLSQRAQLLENHFCRPCSSISIPR